MHTATLNLTQQETAKIRRTSSRIGYVGVVFGRGPRGARYIPLRTAVYATPEGAQRELDGFNVKSNVIIVRREVVPVQPKLTQVV